VCYCRGLHGNINGVVSSCPTRWGIWCHTKCVESLLMDDDFGESSNGYIPSTHNNDARHVQSTRATSEREKRREENNSGASRGLYLRSYLELPRPETFIFANAEVSRRGTKSRIQRVCTKSALSLSLQIKAVNAQCASRYQQQHCVRARELEGTALAHKRGSNDCCGL
jgi:hypothetical protein